MSLLHFFECWRCGSTCHLVDDSDMIGDDGIVPKYCPWDGQTCEWRRVETREVSDDAD